MKLAEVKATTDPRLSKLLRIVHERGVTPAQLAALVDQIQNPPPLPHNSHKHGRKRIKFGLCSDTHIGSKFADYAALNDLYKRFEIAEVQAIYHAGDLTEGYERRKGHTYECDLHGFDAQVQGVVDRYPQIKGVTTYFITGDHDGWHRDAGGASVGPAVTKARRDMVFLGDCSATIEFTPNCRIMLSHPAKGTAYAISYQVQKQIEALSGGTKPQLLAVGHYHKAEYFFYRNIHAFQTGCLQRQTGWMRRMGLSAHMGGWIVEIWLNCDGAIDRLRQELIPYYE
jgi:predicted phosphodiesterase